MKKNSKSSWPRSVIHEEKIQKKFYKSDLIDRVRVYDEPFYAKLGIVEKLSPISSGRRDSNAVHDLLLKERELTLKRIKKNTNIKKGNPCNITSTKLNRWHFDTIR